MKDLLSRVVMGAMKVIILLGVVFLLSCSEVLADVVMWFLGW